MKTTKAQIKALNACYDNKMMFTCPCCKTESIGHPDIENPGEEKTQVYCHYGCGYIFLEDYQTNQKK